MMQTLGHEVQAGRSLVRRTLVAAVVASAVDLMLFGAANIGWGVPEKFSMLNPVAIVVTTVIAATIAGAGFGVLTRVTHRATPVFRIAMAAVAVLSLAGPRQAMAGAIPGLPRATLATGVTMIALHVLTAGIIAVTIPRPTTRGN